MVPIYFADDGRAPCGGASTRRWFTVDESVEPVGDEYSGRISWEVPGIWRRELTTTHSRRREDDCVGELQALAASEPDGPLGDRGDRAATRNVSWRPGPLGYGTFRM